jgi:hypothetical protein
MPSSSVTDNIWHQTERAEQRDAPTPVTDQRMVTHIVQGRVIAAPPADRCAISYVQSQYERLMTRLHLEGMDLRATVA